MLVSYRSQRRNLKKQKGVGFLLIILALILTATAFAVGQISINKQVLNRSSLTLQKMSLVKDALLGYSLAQAVPGILPCPDFNGDGGSDTVAGGCTVNIGWVPFRTLGLDRLHDAAGERLWYALDPNYAVANIPFNSSLPSRVTVNGIAAAFVVLAPNVNLNNQIRNSSSASSIGNYFEGINADANLFDFQYQRDENHNDQLLFAPLGQFWSMVEEVVVVPQALTVLNSYRVSCGVYPWAATFGASMLNSAINLQQGNIPFDSSQPSDGSVCSSVLSPPLWMRSHWGQQLQYVFCLTADGQCLSVVGDESGNAVMAVIAPGVQLVGQSRITNNLNEYYEGDNQSTSTQFYFSLSDNHTAGFNDVLQFSP